MMKRLNNILAIVSLAIVSLTACDEPYGNGIDSSKGEGQLSTRNFSIEVLNSTIDIETRAANINTDDFTVRIKNGDAVVKSYRYAEMPGVITLDAGTTYTVEAFNAEESVNPDWEVPFYHASTDVRITKDKMEDLGKMTLKMKNVKVSVRYGDSWGNNLPTDRVVSVKVGRNENQIDENLDFVGDESRCGFFKYHEESKTLVANFKGTINGTQVSQSKVLADIAPGQHRILTFDYVNAPDAPADKGNIIIMGEVDGKILYCKVQVYDLTRDLNLDEDEIDPFDNLKLSATALTLNADGAAKTFVVDASSAWSINGIEDWLTVTPTSGDKGETTVSVSAAENTENEARTATLTVAMGSMTKTVKITQSKAAGSEPTITSDNVDLENGLTMTIADAKKFTGKVTLLITTPKGLANLFVEIISNTLTPDELKSAGLTDKFDCVYPGEYEEGLTGLNLPAGESLKGSTETIFDISDFMGLLAVLGPSNNEFKLRAVDLEGQEVSATLKITFTE